MSAAFRWTSLDRLHCVLASVCFQVQCYENEAMPSGEAWRESAVAAFCLD